jgi:cbb3-type cytochrome oxidase subunit 1
MKASSLSFLIAVAIAAAGMIWGIVMAISQDHSAMPAHAHLNLLGWVSLFLFGLFYRLHPALDVSRIAKIQVWVWTVGTIAMTIGVWMLQTGRPGGDPYAGAGAFIVLVDVLLFGWLVLKHERLSA